MTAMCWFICYWPVLLTLELSVFKFLFFPFGLTDAAASDCLHVQLNMEPQHPDCWLYHPFYSFHLIHPSLGPTYYVSIFLVEPYGLLNSLGKSRPDLDIAAGRRTNHHLPIHSVRSTPNYFHDALQTRSFPTEIYFISSLGAELVSIDWPSYTTLEIW